MTVDRYSWAEKKFRNEPVTWLVTGAAGFIGSHLVERLLSWGQNVIGLDNFSSGRVVNLQDVEGMVTTEQWKRFQFHEGDILDEAFLNRVVADVTIVLHQAALGSVPRSIKDPHSTIRANINGTLNVFEAARRSGVSHVVYASSSSVYGDSKGSPKEEGQRGAVLSPYAASKMSDELLAEAYSQMGHAVYVGLRYFNVFGPRQNPEGEYAAVIPRWIQSLIQGEVCTIYGDGETSRDFCYVENVVRANLLAASVDRSLSGRAYNIALGDETSLNQLYCQIADYMGRSGVKALPNGPRYENFRAGDIRHSRANIARAQAELGYVPCVKVREGLEATVEWYTAR